TSSFRQMNSMTNDQVAGIGGVCLPTRIDGRSAALRGLWHGIQRKSRVCAGAQDAHAQYAPLSLAALAAVDFCLLSGAGAADVLIVCTWLQPGQFAVACGGAGGGGDWPGGGEGG